MVNGPEVLNKYVGASEENIRNLFADAEKDQATKGEESDLHVIIFDEIDAICKARGSVSSGSGEPCRLHSAFAQPDCFGQTWPLEVGSLTSCIMCRRP